MRASLLLPFALLAVAVPAHAQLTVPLDARMPGRMASARVLTVFDDASMMPLAGVQVTLRHVDLGRTHTLVTGADGSVRIPRLPMGDYSLRLRKLGYGLNVYLIPLLPDDAEPMHASMYQIATQLATVVTTGERVPAKLLDFYTRKAMHPGSPRSFITSAEIQKRRPVALSDMLRDRGPRAYECREGPLWVNGMLFMAADAGSSRQMRKDGWNAAAGRIGGSLLDDFHLDEVEAIEVYWGASNIPAQFNASGTAVCAVVVWTR